jgi:hypothetical protein
VLKFICISRWLIAAAFVLVSPTAKTQSEVITLKCNGTMSSGGDQPISILMMLNLADRTVRGIGLPGLIDYPIKITSADDTTIAFSGAEEISDTISSIAGSIDRKSGDLEATSVMANQKTHETFSTITYMLRCKTLKPIG